MTIVAFDLGLTTTGVCWGPTDHDHFVLPAKLRRSPMTDEMRQGRLAWWRSTFAMILLPHPRADVFVEAPIIHAKHAKGSVELLKLHGVLAAVCADNDLTLTPVGNAVIKRFATGSGSADKDDMVAAAQTLGYEVEDHNTADAIHLWRYAVTSDRGAA